MSKLEGQGIKRRRLLQIASAGGATAVAARLLGADVVPARQAAAAGPAAGVKPEAPLYELVSPLISVLDTGKGRRKNFDGNPKNTIKKVQLDAAGWKAFVAMNPTKIREGVRAELSNAHYDQDFIDDWTERFDYFSGKWAWLCDGYENPPEYMTCPTDTGGTNCPPLATDSNKTYFYALPSPKIHDIDQSSRMIRGEGFIDGASIQMFNKPDPQDSDTPIHEIKPRAVKIVGTFRCSVATYQGDLNSGGGHPYVFVVNWYDGGGAFHRVGGKQI